MCATWRCLGSLAWVALVSGSVAFARAPEQVPADNGNAPDSKQSEAKGDAERERADGQRQRGREQANQNRDQRDRDDARRQEDRQQDRDRSEDQRDEDRRDASDRDRTKGPERERDADRTEKDRERDAGRERDADRADGDRQRDADRDRAERRDRRRPDFGADIDVRENRLHVGDVTRDSLAGRIGLRQGDVIVSIDGRRIDSRADFDRYLYRNRGPRVPIIVLRGNDRHTIYYDGGRFFRDGRRFDDRVAEGAWLGVVLDYDQPDRALLREVRPGSPADQAGLRPGDTIVRVNDQQVGSPEELHRLIGQHQPGDRVELYLASQARDPIVVTLGQRPAPRGVGVDVSPGRVGVDAGPVDVNVSPRGVDVDTYRDRRRSRR